MGSSRDEQGALGPPGRERGRAGGAGCGQGDLHSGQGAAALAALPCLRGATRASTSAPRPSASPLPFPSPRAPTLPGRRCPRYFEPEGPRPVTSLHPSAFRVPPAGSRLAPPPTSPLLLPPSLPGPQPSRRPRGGSKGPIQGIAGVREADLTGSRALDRRVPVAPGSPKAARGPYACGQDGTGGRAGASGRRRGDLGFAGMKQPAGPVQTRAGRALRSILGVPGTLHPPPPPPAWRALLPGG